MNSYHYVIPSVAHIKIMKMERRKRFSMTCGVVSDRKNHMEIKGAEGTLEDMRVINEKNLMGHWMKKRRIHLTGAATNP